MPPNELPDELIEHYVDQGKQIAELELIERLLRSGLDPATVESLGLPPSQITQVLNLHFHGKIRVPEDEELLAEARRAAKKALAKFNILIDVAPLPVQVNLMKAVIPAVSRMLGSDKGSSYEDALTAFHDLLKSQRVDAPALPGLPSAGESAAPFIPTDDSDEGFNP